MNKVTSNKNWCSPR